MTSYSYLIDIKRGGLFRKKKKNTELPPPPQIQLLPSEKQNHTPKPPSLFKIPERAPDSSKKLTTLIRKMSSRALNNHPTFISKKESSPSNSINHIQQETLRLKKWSNNCEEATPSRRSSKLIKNRGANFPYSRISSLSNLRQGEQSRKQQRISPPKRRLIRESLIAQLNKIDDQREKATILDEISELQRKVSVCKCLEEILQQLELLSYCQPQRIISNIGQLLLFQIFAEALVLAHNIPKAIKKLKHAEFFSRSMNLERLTLYLCFRLAELYRLGFQYDQSAKYIKSAYNLAQKLGDKYSQMRAVDLIGMCFYYRGNSNLAHMFHSAGSSNTESQASLMVLASENYEDSFNNVPGTSQFDERNHEYSKVYARQLVKSRQFRQAIGVFKRACSKVGDVGQVKQHVQEKCSRVFRDPYHSEGSKEKNFISQVIMTHRTINRNPMTNGKDNSEKIDKQLRMLIGEVQAVAHFF